MDEGGDLLLGEATMQREGGWNLLCKFFDNMGAIPHHLHQNDEFAALVGQKGKPEAYYFPPQYQPDRQRVSLHVHGTEPGTTMADVRRCLEDWNKGDNGILVCLARIVYSPAAGGK